MGTTRLSDGRCRLEEELLCLWHLRGSLLVISNHSSPPTEAQPHVRHFSFIQKKKKELLLKNIFEANKLESLLGEVMLALEGVKYNFTSLPSCQWEPESKKVCRAACPPVCSLPTEKINSAFTITGKRVFKLFLNLCTAGDATGTTGSPGPCYSSALLSLAMQGNCSLYPAQERRLLLSSVLFSPFLPVPTCHLISAKPPQTHSFPLNLKKDDLWSFLLLSLDPLRLVHIAVALSLILLQHIAIVQRSRFFQTTNKVAATLGNHLLASQHFTFLNADLNTLLVTLHTATLATTTYLAISFASSSH